MSESLPNWHDWVRSETDAEQVENRIETINMFLEDEPAKVIEEMASELRLSLRALRHFTQKTAHESSAEAKSTVLSESDSLTFEGFAQALETQIADAYEMSKLLGFYAMALEEQKAST